MTIVEQVEHLRSQIDQLSLELLAEQKKGSPKEIIRPLNRQLEKVRAQFVSALRELPVRKAGPQNERRVYPPGYFDRL